MSYNITNWRTKELKDFRLPIDRVTHICHLVTDHKHERTYMQFTEGDIHGHIEGDWFVVEEFQLWGVWSGNGLTQLIESVFPFSQGKLSATLVWEGGDSIERLTVEDGKIKREDINL